ncbi:hypothetical protein ETH_00006535 [Eimeria tenella]|uniref:Uncharacterized protein n=1 Tax=Eimeria tenella TaxID=5802 RepID=U6KXH0_EIMTE|nr:hypothetical protein ETH_00006535 [Eimeria tenella]CDJ42661.1 hypothetical protein ETH_00006535 [Eimeria tenella]|eukprot:XP_013233411.1 hypothetical protein ETH_00006535 [Eimeria tenella]
MQTCSARGCIPSLSLALGETVEIEVYVHSALLLPLPLDAVAVRLSGVPAAAQGISQPPSAAAAAAAAATSELSGWLVVTSASLQRQQQQHEQQQELPHPQELVLHPGINVLRLLWCCCQPGLFLVEQICFLLNDIVFMQWAGDLPPPALLPRVAAAMERALVGVSGAAAAAAAAVDTNTAINSLSDKRNDNSNSSSSSSSVPALSEAAEEAAATATAAAAAAARPCTNPYYVREDAGDQLSAAAFAERLYGDPRTFAVSSCSPAGATLLHPCAALERLLHPLMLEYRHSSSCVAVQVDPLLPQQHHLLLQRLKNLQQQQQQQEHMTGDLLQGNTNVLLEGVQSSLLLTINVPWGFVDGGTPRLRVLQALSVGAPSSCSSSVEDEEEAVESFSASELQTLPTESFSDAKGTPAAASAHGAPKVGAPRAATHVAFGRMQQSSSRDSGSWSCNEASSTPGAAGAAAAQEAGGCLQAAHTWGPQASHMQRTACSSCCSTFSFPRPLQLLIDWEGALCLSIDGSPSVFPLSQFKQDPTGQAMAPTAAATGTPATAATAATAGSKASRLEVQQVQQEIICDSEGAEVVVAVPRLSDGGNSSSSSNRSSSDSSSDEEEVGWIPLPPFRSCVQLLLPVCVSCAPGWGLAGGTALQQMHTGDSFYPRGEWLPPADAAGESPLSASRMQWRFQGSCGACEDMKGPSSDSALSGGPSGASRCRCSSISISDSLSRSRPTRAPPAAAVGRGLVTVATALSFTCRKRLPAAADAAAAAAASTTTPAAHNEDEDLHELGVFPAAVALDGANDAEDTAEEAESMQRHSSRSNCAPSSSSKTSSSSSSGEPELMVIRLHSVEVSAALTHCLSLSRVSDALQVVQVLLKAASAADRLMLVSASIRPRQQQQQQDELQLGAPSVSLIAPPDPLSNEAVAQIGESVTLGSRLPPGAVQTLLVKVQYPLPSYGAFSLLMKNRSGSSSNSGDSNSSSSNSSSSNSSSSNRRSSNSPSTVFYDLVVSYEVDGGNLGSSVPECCGSLGGLSYPQRSSSSNSSNSSSNCSHSSRSSLSYVIPLQLPARAPPLLTALDCPRTGRVGSALCVQLRITNTTHEAMEICHRVCLEFDRQDPPGSQVRGGPPGTPGALEKRRQRASGGTQTPAKSPRVGECHDWLMAGSKCRAVLLEGGRSTNVSFSAIPLRAGSLCLPFVRLLYRRAPPGGACEGLGAWGGPPGPSAAAASALIRGPLAAAGNRGAAANACSSPEASPWVPLHGGESLTAGREVLVLPKLVSTPEVRLLQDYSC